MRFPRRCGILLHPTCLPGPGGIGSLGAEARRFLDWMAEAGQTLWQVCPLGPTGFGDSPYQCFSAFAGNPMLIDLEELAAFGLLEPGELAGGAGFPEDHVDFGPVIEWKNAMLQAAFERFRGGAGPAGLRGEFRDFCAREAGWLEDFALFMALKAENGGRAWVEWPAPVARRQAPALGAARERLAESLDRRRFDQFLFSRQWAALRAYAHSQGVQIVGDMPIFVAHDSADVWARPDLFQLDAQGNPVKVAGVPPDYFSETGQRWGNPLYKWPAHKKEKFAWWISRFQTLLQLVDIVRIDHFRGFEACWEIPAPEPTAVRGEWVKAPGEALFLALRKTLGALPIIAEDLGVITPEVDALREQFEFPGMKVLQFGFSEEQDPENAHLPHNFESNCVVYTGTHDNETTLGWYRSQPEKTRDHARRYLWCDGSNIAWDFIRMAYLSVADTAIIPAQDALALGAEGRLNFPGRPQGNWSWRLRPGALTAGHAEGLRGLAELYSRLPEEEEESEKTADS